MKLMIARHGQASFEADTDQERKLTPKGLTDTQVLGAQITQWQTQYNVKVAQALISPYTRTQQTFAQINLSLSLAASKQTLSELFTPESNPTKALEYLEQQAQCDDAQALVIVTHQPFVSSLIALLCEGATQAAYQYPMNPASCVLLELDGIYAGAARVLNESHA